MRRLLLPKPCPLSAADSYSSGGGSLARRVLVVDDNRDAAETLALLLELTGHQTCTAHDGPAALAAGAEFVPDIVLLDIGLPRMNGYEVCRRLRELEWGRKAFVVALTGWGQAEDQRKASEAGFDRHLVKPVEEEVLLKVLQEAADFAQRGRHPA
jgi:CheY-like chemotaxis protein